MLMPSIFGENFMDDFFGVPERTYTQSAQNALMKTDVVAVSYTHLTLPTIA